MEETKKKISNRIKNIDMKNRIIILILIVFIFGACSPNIDKIDLVKDKFLKTSLLIRNNNYMLILYYKDRRDTYIYKYDEDRFNLLRDTTEYQDVVGEFYYGDKLNEDSVKSMLGNLLITLEDCQIKEYRTDWRGNGIDLKIYMEDGTELYYIKNVENVIPSWKSYVNELKKLNDNWYKK